MFPRPRIGLKQPERLLVHAPDVLSNFPRVAIDEVFPPAKECPLVALEGKVRQAGNVQPINKSLRKDPVLMAACKSRFVAAITRTSARIRRVPPTRSNSRSCKDTQESNLSLGWKFSDFVEEDRASTRKFKSAQAAAESRL